MDYKATADGMSNNNRSHVVRPWDIFVTNYLVDVVSILSNDKMKYCIDIYLMGIKVDMLPMTAQIITIARAMLTPKSRVSIYYSTISTMSNISL